VGLHQMIVVIIGLPASGKSSYAKVLNIPVYDDIQSLDELPSHRNGDFALISCEFCDETVRKAAENILISRYRNNPIKWVYYKNDPLQCRKNSLTRPDKPVIGEISRLTQIYNPPFISKEVWKAT